MPRGLLPGGRSAICGRLPGGIAASLTSARDQLAAALADARLGKYDVLLVWALNRLDREGVESTLGLLRRFHEAAARCGR